MNRKPQTFWIGGLLFLLAVLPRLWLTTTSRFTDDEAIIWSQAKYIAEGKALPVLGPVVTGGIFRAPGAAGYYLIAMSQLISKTPEAANFLLAVLTALTVIVFWSSLRRPFGEISAFLTALVFSFSPWNLLYSDRLWNANLTALLTAICLWAALRLLENPKSRSVAVLLFAAGIYPQFHLTAPVLWIALAVLLRKTMRQWNVKWFGIGLVLVAAAYVPYVLSELQTGFVNFHAYLQDGKAQGFRVDFLRVPFYAFRMLTLDVTYQELMGYWGPYREWAAVKALFLGTPDHPFSVLRLLLTAASFYFAGWAIKESFKKGPQTELFRELRTATVAGVAAAFLLLAVSKKVFVGHYLQYFTPFLFLAYAHLFQSSLSNRDAFRKCVALSLFFCFGGLETSVTISRGIDARNSLGVERQVLKSILRQGLLKEGQSLGLNFKFLGGSKFAYQVLLKEDFNERFLVVTPPGDVNYTLFPVASKETGESIGPVILTPGLH